MKGHARPFRGHPLVPLVCCAQASSGTQGAHPTKTPALHSDRLLQKSTYLLGFTQTHGPSYLTEVKSSHQTLKEFTLCTPNIKYEIKAVTLSS